LYLAVHSDRLVSVQEVSRAYRVSPHHMVKIVQRLVAQGLIASVRGRGGGLRLNRKPDAINIGAVVRLTEPHMALVECFNRATNTCPIEPACGLKGTLVQAQRAFLDVLRGTPARPNPPGDLNAILVYAADNAAGLAAVVGAQGEGGQERSHFVPWFKTEFPQHVLISQLLAHSAQHRSELAWELARAGVSTSELDFIVWVAGGRPEPGDKPSFPGGPQQ